MRPRPRHSGCRGERIAGTHIVPIIRLHELGLRMEVADASTE
jgi:hypothetical protein